MTRKVPSSPDNDMARVPGARRDKGLGFGLMGGNKYATPHSHK
jgi:hypothetical protein